MIVKTPLGDLMKVVKISFFNDGPVFGVLFIEMHGVVSFKASECQIIDPKITFKTTYYEAENAVMIAHWALIEKELHDPVQDHEKWAFDQFIEVLRSEGELD